MIEEKVGLSGVVRRELWATDDLRRARVSCFLVSREPSGVCFFLYPRKAELASSRFIELEERSEV
jgi:hypothetical protein